MQQGSMELVWAPTSDALEFLWCDRAWIEPPFRDRVSHLDNTMKPSKTKVPGHSCSPCTQERQCPSPWSSPGSAEMRFVWGGSFLCMWVELLERIRTLIFGKIWRQGTGKRKPEEDLYSLSDSSWKTPWGFGNTPALGLQSSRCPS